MTTRRRHRRRGTLPPLLLAAALVLAPGTAAGQEPTGPDRIQRPAPGVQRTVRLENHAVLAVEIRYDPGAEAPRHAHRWDRLVHVLDGGTLELVADDGSVQRLEVTPGMTVWRPAETHRVRNVGRTTVRTLEVEVKGGG